MNIRSGIDAAKRELGDAFNGGCAACRSWSPVRVVMLPNDEEPATCARCGRVQALLAVADPYADAGSPANPDPKPVPPPPPRDAA